MIYTCLEGGLGNQLFQYAAGRALAHRHSTDLILDTARLGIKKPQVTPRGLEIHSFKHTAVVAKLGEYSPPAWLHHVPTLSRLFGPWRMYVEKPNGFNSDFLQLPDQTYLHGYWQSHLYFLDIATELYHELVPKNPISPLSQGVAEQIEAASEASIAIHVRRGDYVTLPSAADYHGVLPLSYYITALECIYTRIQSPLFFVFSDDPTWCRENLPLQEHDTVFVEHNGGADAWQDLVLMSLCRHHIIANSSFSWWGAWLADQRWLGLPRVVVAPSRWFAGRNLKNLADRFPPHWTVL